MPFIRRISALHPSVIPMIISMPDTCRFLLPRDDCGLPFNIRNSKQSYQNEAITMPKCMHDSLPTAPLRDILIFPLKTGQLLLFTQYHHYGFFLNSTNTACNEEKHCEPRVSE
jgi:hypothetical protein